MSENKLSGINFSKILKAIVFISYGIAVFFIISDLDLTNILQNEGELRALTLMSLVGAGLVLSVGLSEFIEIVRKAIKEKQTKNVEEPPLQSDLQRRKLLYWKENLEKIQPNQLKTEQKKHTIRISLPIGKKNKYSEILEKEENALMGDSNWK